jgi:hypothetical protein
MLRYLRSGIGGLRYKVDSQRIAHQEVDGEVIVIDFVAGTYFSMQATAGEIWQMLVAGADSSAIVARYPNAAGAADEIPAFLDELLAANLVEIDDAAIDGVPSALPENRLPYATPRLEIFEDLADLIMLDPVHDVTEAGWPHAPTDNH